jgi:hypothetical protein
MNKKEVYYTIVMGNKWSHELGESPLFNSQQECFEYVNEHFNVISYNIIKVELSLANLTMVCSN